MYLTHYDKETSSAGGGQYILDRTSVTCLVTEVRTSERRGGGHSSVNEVGERAGRREPWTSEGLGWQTGSELEGLEEGQ